MIRHIVMYKYKDDAQGKSKAENLAIAKQLAETMGKEIPEMKFFQCGIGSAEQNPANYDVTLICDFENFQALAAYKQNPAHKAFGTHSHSVCEARAAIDFEI